MSVMAFVGFAGLALLAGTYVFKRSRTNSRESGALTKLAVRIVEIKDEAEGIKSFRLEPEPGNQLPEATPGSHISVWLADDLVRHYSICNLTSASDHYLIAVKLEKSSRGGSQAMHSLRVGDVLEISAPRNNFELINGAARYLLFAGGIGITPIVSMVRTLEAKGANYHLHYFTRSRAHTAFHVDLSTLDFAKKVSFHHAVEPGALRQFLLKLLTPIGPGAHLYVCGPRPFMDAVEDAARLLLPSHAVHREYFTADALAATGPREEFEVELARSGKKLLVPADASLLDVLNRNGVSVEHSCQEGICGTCLTRVLEGEPDHRDSFLTEAERKSGDKMLVCVSRAKTAKLVLEL